MNNLLSIIAKKLNLNQETDLERIIRFQNKKTRIFLIEVCICNIIFCATLCCPFSTMMGVMWTTGGWGGFSRTPKSW